MTQILIFLLLLPFSSAENVTGLIFAGGFRYPNDVDSVELWSPGPEGVHCFLAPFTREMSNRAVSLVSGSLVACNQGSCDILRENAWQKMQNTLKVRQAHTSAVVKDKILLMGGRLAASGTTEMLPVDGGASEFYVPLDPGRQFHCGIQVKEDTVVLTGGYQEDGYTVSGLVDEYSGLGREGEVTYRRLPDLKKKRQDHACGVYLKEGKEWLIVAGGQSQWDELLYTTEIYDYSQGTQGKWQWSGSLPTVRAAVAGASLNGVFHVAGGGNYAIMPSEILAFDPVSESWSTVGQIAETRSANAVLAVYDFPVTPETCSPVNQP